MIPGGAQHTDAATCFSTTGNARAEGFAMDYTEILALISFLTGNAEHGFATLKASTTGSAPITQIICPRPLPVNEIEGKTVFCGTVQVPEDHSKPDGKKTKRLGTKAK